MSSPVRIEPLLWSDGLVLYNRVGGEEVKDHDFTEAEFDELWEKGERVEVIRPKKATMSVFSMKIDRDLFKALVDRAQEMDIPPSALARHFIAEGLLANGAEMPTEQILKILQKRIRDLERAG